MQTASAYRHAGGLFSMENSPRFTRDEVSIFFAESQALPDKASDVRA